MPINQLYLLVKLFPDKDWNWTSLSSKVPLHLIKELGNKPWNPEHVSINDAVAFEDVIENPTWHLWDWHTLSYHPNITWEQMRSSPDLPWKNASCNPNITWEIIKANPDYDWDWTDLLENKNITWDIVKNNMDKPWRREIEIEVRYPNRFDCYIGDHILKEIAWEYRGEEWREPWNIYGTNCKEYLPEPSLCYSSDEEIKKMELEPRDYHKLSQNQNISWNFILERKNERWDWFFLSKREDLTWNKVQQNSDIPWRMGTLSGNLGISLDDISSHSDLFWDWRVVSRRKDLTWKFIQKHMDKPMVWQYVCEQPFLTESLVEENMNIFDSQQGAWKGISSNQNMSWQFLAKYSEKVCWEQVCHLYFRYQTSIISIQRWWRKYAKKARKIREWSDVHTQLKHLPSIGIEYFDAMNRFEKMIL